MDMGGILRGKIRARACVTQGIHPGVVCMERFWNPENLDKKTHGWQEMNVNVLSKSSAPYNDVVGTYTLRAFQVKALSGRRRTGGRVDETGGLFVLASGGHGADASVGCSV